jgi:hypothetical protein
LIVVSTTIKNSNCRSYWNGRAISTLNLSSMPELYQDVIE